MDAGMNGVSASLMSRSQYSTESRSGASGRSAAQTAELSAQEQAALAQLKQRDQAVRAHESAHVAAGGELITSRASFTYQLGPDSKRYAVAGEVGIDTSPGNTPEETLSRAQRIRDTALAPADPSAQDRRVAAMADRMAQTARLEMNAQRAEAGDGGSTMRERDLARMVAAVSGDEQSAPAIDIFA